MTITTITPKARFLARLAARVGAWSLAALITALSLVPPSFRPATGTPHDFEHFAIFCATGLAFSLGYPRNRPKLALMLVIFAGAIEVAQIFRSRATRALRRLHRRCIGDCRRCRRCRARGARLFRR